MVMKILFFEPKLCIKTYKYARSFWKLGHRIEMAYLIGKFDLNYNLDASFVKAYHKVVDIPAFLKLARGYNLVICKDINGYVSKALDDKKIKLVLLVGDVQSGRTKDKRLVPIEKTVFTKILPQRVVFSGTFLRAHAVSLLKMPQLAKSPVIPNVPTNEALTPKPKLSATDGKLHLVYCGCLQNNDGHRNFKKLFAQIVKFPDIVLHIIPTKYKIGIDNLGLKSSNLVIHPTVKYNKLHSFLTQFDIGLCLFDMSYADREYIHVSEANKFYDYLYAGLPVVANDSRSYRDLVNRWDCGMVLGDVKADFAKKLKTIKGKKIKWDIRQEGLEVHLRRNFGYFCI